MQVNEDRATSVPTPNREGGSPLRPSRYPRELVRAVSGEDGACYELRPIRPDDAPRLVAFHRGLSPHSVYLRYFSFHPSLSAAEVEHLTCVDYVDRLALVVTLGHRIIAVGRFDRPPGETEAEVAFVVADEYQHHGLGTLLLDELAHAARQRGVTTFRADTLGENATMLDVFHHAGFAVTSHCESGVVTVRFPIALTDAYRAALEQREATRRLPDVGRAPDHRRGHLGGDG